MSVETPAPETSASSASELTGNLPPLSVAALPRSDRDLTEPTAAPRVAALPYDALLFLSFGGPEGPDDVLPFLENVLRGKPVPRERMLEVAEHYNHFGGVSPINEHARELIAACRDDFAKNGLDLPIYWGNRNWHPMLPDTLAEMARDGVRTAIAFVLSAYSSYSGCRQYREDIRHAQAAVGLTAPAVDKIRVFYNHPDWVSVNAAAVAKALDDLPNGGRERAHIAFTAHSIPTPMAAKCAYRKQLLETSRLVAETVGIPEQRWELVFQSRSGRPQDPWLEPDICDHIETLGQQGVRELVVAPIGFLSDHMEVLFDLDHEAKDAADSCGIEMRRAGTAGASETMVQLVRKLVQERCTGTEHEATGRYPANHDVCPLNCCPPPPYIGRPRSAGGGRPAAAGGRPAAAGERGSGRPATSGRPGVAARPS